MTDIKSTIFFCLLFFLVLRSVSQEFKPLSSNETLKNSYIEFVDNSTDELSSSYKGEYKSETKDFYKGVASDLKAMVEVDAFLFEEKSLQYLNTVLDNIKEANDHVNLEQVKIVLSKNHWGNAFCVPDGTIAFHVGIIPYFNNEDQLAAILCHELAHFLRSHSHNSRLKHWANINSDEFKSELKSISKSKYETFTKLEEFILDNSFSQRAHDRDLEHDADSVGFELYSNTDYSLWEFKTALANLEKMNSHYDNTSINIFKTLKIDSVGNQNSELLEIEDVDLKVQEKLMKSHPDVEKRVEVVNRQLQKLNLDSSSATPSQEFLNFKENMTFQLCESYMLFEQYDYGLIHSLRMLNTYPDSDYLKAIAAWSMFKLYSGRKNHNVSEYCGVPYDYPDPDLKKLVNVVYFQRFSKIRKTVYNWCKENYTNSQENVRYLLAYARIAEDLEMYQEVEMLKNKYTKLHPKGIYKKSFPYPK